MTGEESVDLAYEVLRPESPLPGALRARAAALLLRQALERAVAEAWRTAGYEPVRSMRAQLLCLRGLVDEPTAEEATDLWGQLSGICHHHPYALAPTGDELGGIRARVHEVVHRLRSAAILVVARRGMRLPYHPGADTRPICDAAARFVDASLRKDGSLFTPGQRIWTRENADDLYARFVEQPDESSDSFLAKFERQLTGAPDATIQLAAEMLYVHVLIARDIGGRSKRETIHQLLAWMSAPPQIPAELDRSLDVGLARTGVAFKTYRPFQLWLLVDFLRAWKALSPPERQRLLEDPWAFKAFLFDLPLTAAYAQREALLHLVHPRKFEPIVSRDHKRSIVDAFRDRVRGDTEDADRALAEIRASLESETGREIWFYEPGIVEAWQPPEEPDEDRDLTSLARAWLVRANVRGIRRLERWLTEGYCSIGWREVGEVEPGAPREELLARVRDAYPDMSTAAARASVGNIDRFVNRMKVGDLVVTPDGSDVYVGLVTSAPYHVEGDEARRRSVEWANPKEPLQRSDLTDSAYSKLRTLLTVSEITEDLEEFARLVGLHLATSPPATPQTKSDLALPPVTDQVADRLLLPREWLQETVDLLGDKRQLIFYGPPGTGKTYVAQRLADHVTARGGAYTLVQFHPSYAYEDFFEGFRPRPARDDTMGVSFDLVPRPLRRIAETARNDPDNPYLLIIDEINRANLAKVFGELYFLLEYRDQTIALQYSPAEDEFRLPRNLFIIGTMNTADRSIALVDAAMRRRFYFVPFFPRQHPIDQLLRRWRAADELPIAPADLLDELNVRIGDEDFAVGPSYLMTHQVAEPGGLERIWRHAVLPLLEEHFFGSGVDVEQRFGLASLRRAVAARATSAPLVAGFDEENAEEVPGRRDLDTP